MLVDYYIGVACGQVICSSILHNALTLNLIKMRLLFFILSGIMISITFGLTSGELQKYVKFNSVDSEIFMAMLCGVAGLFFLIYSVERDETED